MWKMFYFVCIVMLDHTYWYYQIKRKSTSKGAYGSQERKNESYGFEEHQANPKFESAESSHFVTYIREIRATERLRHYHFIGWQKKNLV